MPGRVVEGFEGIRALVGIELPPTDWVVVHQQQIDAFAACTGDAQWIHVDLQRAAQSEYGSTIAHGYLVLSLIPALWNSAYEVRSVGPAINYGLDRVRFASPLRAGTRIRACFLILQARESAIGLRVVKRVTIEGEGCVKPICVADTIALYRPDDRRYADIN